MTTRGDGAAGISIRGGTATENLVLLDGIPMFNASHFTSAASAIDPDALSGLDVHTGVSSARFGGRLSGVVELETAELGGDSVRVTGGFGPTDVRSMVRGPLGRPAGFWWAAGSLSAISPTTTTATRARWQASTGTSSVSHA